MRGRRISIICGAAFSFAASGIAFAADMAVKAPPPPPEPVYNWTGWYAGFNFGGGFGTSNNATTTSTLNADGLAQFFPGSSPSGSTAGANSGVAGLNQSGPIGGVQIGYNFQLNPLFVFGFEADIQGAAINSRSDNTGISTESFAGTSGQAVAGCNSGGTCMGSSTGTAFFKTAGTANSAEVLAAAWTNPVLTANGSDLVTADLNWLGTARVRAGYLVTPNLLLYATGGLAYGDVSASDSATTNFNLSADSFALAYGQATGPGAVALVNPVNAGTNPLAIVNALAGGVGLNCTGGSIFVCTRATAEPTLATGLAVAKSGTGGALENQATVNGPPTSAAIATASVASPVALSAVSYAQSTKPLSVAIATTTQSFARVSDIKYGGTIGGGFEWMMAPNWSVKTEALYYDLGSVTVTAPLTSSINPITAAIPATVNNTSIASVSSAINKFTGAATVSNTAATRVSFQGVIIRVGLNYHFN